MAFYDHSLPRVGIMTLGYYYGLPGTNAGEHSYGGSFGYWSCLPRVPLRCRKTSGSIFEHGSTNPCQGVGISGGLAPEEAILSCGSPWLQPYG
jgi:hypothetical protein